MCTLYIQYEYMATRKFYFKNMNQLNYVLHNNGKLLKIKEGKIQRIKKNKTRTSMAISSSGAVPNIR